LPGPVRSKTRSETQMTLQEYAQALEQNMTVTDVEVLKGKRTGDISLDKMDSVADVALSIAFCRAWHPET